MQKGIHSMDLLQYRKIFSYQQTLKVDSVAPVFREPGVLTGYRLPEQPWHYYLVSVFQIHNETVNIWTHLIATFLFLGKIITYVSYNTGSETEDEVKGVFVFFCACSALNSFLSTFAHAFHSKSPLLHYTSFQGDYAGIGLYGVGLSVLVFHTSCPPSVHDVLDRLLLPLNVVLGWFLMSGGCTSKLLFRPPYPFQRKVMQLGTGLAHFMFGGMPIMSRYVLCVYNADCSVASLSHHTYYIITFTLSLAFFSSHLPEKKFHGHFDTIGQGHNIFHILITMTAMLQIEAATHDVIHNDTSRWVVSIPNNVDLLLTFIAYCIGCLVIILTLRQSVQRRLTEDEKYF